MTRKDDSLEGMGLHGQAVVAALDLYDDLRHTRPALSDVAKRLNVEADQLRAIFPDDEALIIAIGEQALVRLIDDSTKAVVKVPQDDAVGQFTALGEAYITWVARHPVQYQLLADDSYLGPKASAHLRRYLDSLNTLMERILLRAQANGTMAADKDVRMIVLSSRIFACGLAQMLVDKRLSEWNRDVPAVQTARQVMQQFVRSFARGNGQRPPLTSGTSRKHVTADH